VCSIVMNKTANDIFTTQEEKDRKMIEKRLIEFAKSASITISGALDIPPLKRMPPELKETKKITIGRHRVYYHGHHSQCNYTSFYIKKFKKSGVNDEDDTRFQKILTRAIRDSDVHPLGEKIVSNTQDSQSAEGQPSEGAEQVSL
jgi:hypothetical protein